MHSTDKVPEPAVSGSGRGKCIKRIFQAAIVLGVFIFMNWLASVGFDKLRVADYYHYDLNQLEKENTDIDLVVVGASQVIYACNTELLAREMGLGGAVIDCANPGSYCDGMYYMLKDLLQRFSPKYVVIDLPWSKFIDQTSASMSRYLSADRMSFPGKLDYAVHCMTMEEAFTVFCPLYRYGKWVMGPGQIKSRYLARKAIRDGNWGEDPKRKYRKNGFVWEDRSCPQGGIPALLYAFSYDDIREEYADYVRKMVKLCKEKGIPAALMTLPASCANIYGISNYQASVDYTQDLADELGCPYLNFNLLKGREDLFPDTVFWDTRHMNGEGSVAFTPVFVEAAGLAFRGEDTGALFYKDVEEMKKDVHRIVACSGTVTPNPDGTAGVEVWSLQNEDITPQYRLMLVEKKAGAADQNNRIQELSPWQEETTFLVDRSEIPEGYVLRVEARQKGNEEYDAFQNLSEEG